MITERDRGVVAVNDGVPHIENSHGRQSSPTDARIVDRYDLSFALRPLKGRA
jgi:hypothetical protein